MWISAIRYTLVGWLSLLQTDWTPSSVASMTCRVGLYRAAFQFQCFPTTWEDLSVNKNNTFHLLVSHHVVVPLGHKPPPPAALQNLCLLTSPWSLPGFLGVGFPQSSSWCDQHHPLNPCSTGRVICRWEVSFEYPV